MRAREALEDGLSKIAKPEHWQRGSAARDAFGAEVGSTDDEACRWCAYGALAAATDLEQMPLWSAMRQLAKHMGAEAGDSDSACALAVFAFNDSHSHADVVAAFEAAIKDCLEGSR